MIIVLLQFKNAEILSHLTNQLVLKMLRNEFRNYFFHFVFISLENEWFLTNFVMCVNRIICEHCFTVKQHLKTAKHIRTVNQHK